MVYTIAKLVSAFAFGLVIGCYLNTLEYRLSADVRLFDSSCYCTSCGARLRLRDQIPVFSYLWLGGRCRSCGVRKSDAVTRSWRREARFYISSARL